MAALGEAAITSSLWGKAHPRLAHRAAFASHLAVGATGDASILELAEGQFEYRDVLGELRRGDRRLTPAAWWSAAAGGIRRGSNRGVLRDGLGGGSYRAARSSSVSR